MTDSIHVLAISGSLRKGSFNTAAIHAAMALLPSGMTMELADLSAIPVYNGDVEAAGVPEAVKLFREKIRKADALLIATPEYNYSIPGVLKNAIDWASRPPTDPVFTGKPLAIMGASMGIFGSVRAQYHLRQVCIFINLLPINKPEVMIGKAHEKFDAQGKLTDETSKGLIKQLLEALSDWTRRLR